MPLSVNMNKLFNNCYIMNKLNKIIPLSFLLLILCLTNEYSVVQGKQYDTKNFNTSAWPNDLCYTNQMRYQSMIKKTPIGEIGICILPNGDTVDSWHFFRGEIYHQYTYCARRGYGTIPDTTSLCAACVQYDSLNHITWKMRMDSVMNLYGDTLCNGVLFNFSAAKIK
jgi:putative hemolysin